jgi:protein-tyrosine-phosphatase/predicted ATP-grasp superfamily ATP-dependent carboligase
MTLKGVPLPGFQKPPVALVIGSDTRAFLGVVRSLGRRGVAVHVAPFDHASAALASRYVHQVHRLSPPQLDPVAWAEEVVRLATSVQADFVVPCDDRSIIPLQHFEAQAGRLRLALPGARAFEAFFDKGHTRALAAACGVPVPPGRVLGAQDTAEQLVAEYGLPLFIKPRNSYLLRSLESRRNVVACHSLAAVTAALEGLHGAERRDEYLVEAQVTGTGVGVSVLAQRGVVSQVFQHRRVREPVHGGGSSYRRSEVLTPSLLEMTLALCQASALEGVAMFEYRVDDATGQQALLEVNARFWGSLPLAMAAGVDFPYLWFSQAQGIAPAPRLAYRVPFHARNLMADLYATAGHVESRRSEGRWVQVKEGLAWLASLHRVLLGRESLDTLALDDLRPGLREFGTIAGRFGDRITRDIPWVQRRRGAELRQAVEQACREAAGQRRPVNVVVACFGNICRSPYAAAAMVRALHGAAPVWQVTGGALACRAPRPSPEQAVQAAARRGVDLSAHRSLHASDQALQEADLVFVFDASNLELLASRGLRLKRAPIRLGELVLEQTGRADIADPVDRDAAFFDRTYSVIDDALRELAVLPGVTGR